MKKKVFIISSPRYIKTEPASFRRIHAETIVFLPEKSNGFITSRFNGDELKRLFHEKHRLWIEILNRSFVDNIVIKKTSLSVTLWLNQKIKILNMR